MVILMNGGVKKIKIILLGMRLRLEMQPLLIRKKVCCSLSGIPEMEEL